MPQDAFTLKFLCEELNNVFANGKINKIVQPDNDKVVFTIWNGKKTEKLLLDVNPANPRISIIEENMDSPLTAPNFCMLLRKHLLSATIKEISLVGFDRVVKIEMLSSSEFFDAGEKTLFVELMGRYSNIILTQNGKVLGGNRGINFFDNGVRPLILGLDYVYPPVGEKKVPTDQGLIENFNKLNINFSNPTKEDIVVFAKYLCENVQGLAMSTAEEIVLDFFIKNKVSNSLQQNYGQLIFNHLGEFIRNVKKKPCVFFDEKGIKDVCVYPYSRINGDKKFFETLYLAEEFYFSEKLKNKRFNEKKERLKNSLISLEKKLKKRLVAINARIKDSLDAEQNKIKGELILANIYKIKKGDVLLVAENYYNGTKESITIDNNISPSANAERYYKKYNKQKRSLLALQPQKEQAEKELEYILSIQSELSIADDIEDVKAIQGEMTIMGLINNTNNKEKAKNKKKQEKIGCRIYEVDGFVIKVGRNNVENDKVTFSARPEDIWLHAKSEHSSHVIIEVLNNTPSEKIIAIAAEICAFYSKGRESGKTEIVYTKKKFVKKPSGAKPGFCVYSEFKSALFLPLKHLEFLKKE